MKHDIKPDAIGVFLWDDAQPATLWEYQGENATGEHVFTRGSITAGDFGLIHQKTLKDFWPLVPSL